VQHVALDRAGTRKATLVLADGAITAVLDEAAPPPPGTRVIDGTGLLCLPAFLDAFSRQGVTVPAPVVDQDLPPDLQADVGIDMRLANRKGIQPVFAVAKALAVPDEQSQAWQKSGFGAALVAPGNQLLSGTSALVTTRKAAMRDLVVREAAFAHAAFDASGGGYPSTLMGYFAQLRQFFLDAQHHAELVRRYEDGRAGPRPPFDADLEAGIAILSGQRLLACEANAADDIERWMRLADEFALRPRIIGGLEAWRVTPLLGERGTAVVLTLDWGKEVDDPRPKESAAEAKEEGATPEAAEAAPEAVEPEPAGEAEAKAAEPVVEYQEPYRVRLERRRKWEEGRDCALRLSEAGVPYVFGTAGQKPSELLEHVRALVKAGLPAEEALAKLTDEAAHFLGVDRRLGVIEAGFDATFALWRSDPLTDEKASVAWMFVDGFPSEFREPPKKASSGAGPAKGIDPTGSWNLTFDVKGEGIESATLELSMEPGGALTGTLEVANPMGGAKVKTDVSGEVSGTELTLSCTLSFGQFSIDTALEAEIDGDSLDGEGSFHGPWSDEPSTQSFKATRSPR